MLNTLRENVPGFDYYSKMGGLNKFWDGYDNQLVCWLDDPAVHRTGDEESVQRFKNVISTGETLVEVKHGSMVFDSSLIIISCNFHPQGLANTCGLDNQEAMHRRFTDMCGAWEIDTRTAASNRLPVHLLRILKRNLEQFNISFDACDMVRKLPVFDTVRYDDLPVLESCNIAEFVIIKKMLSKGYYYLDNFRTLDTDMSNCQMGRRSGRILTLILKHNPNPRIELQSTVGLQTFSNFYSQ